MVSATNGGTFSGAVTFNGGAVFNENSADKDFRVESNNNTHMLFVDGGNDKVMIGLETPDVFNGTTPPLQIEGTDNNKASLSITRNSNDNGQPLLILSKSRGTSVNSDTILQDNDVVGEIVWLGADGNDRNSQVATIQATVDGTPGSNDMPGALSFRTTADGAATATERMRIDSSGNISIGGSIIDSSRLSVTSSGTVKNKDGDVIYEDVLEIHTKKDEGQTWTKTKTKNVYQGIDQSKLVPLLVKTIQELEARVTALESK
jgi:hypothetical protein